MARSATRAPAACPTPDGGSAPGRWRVLAASVPGAGHERTGQGCQDAHHCCRLPGGVLVAAVADGAGSAAFGDLGAAAAVCAAVEALCRREGLPALAAGGEAWRLLLLDAVCEARTAVEAEAAARAVPVRELATTLILLIATPSLVAAAQVGDGAVVLEDGEGHLAALTTPRHGEHLNETTFLVSAEYLSAAQLVARPGGARNIAVFSDGLQMLALKMPAGTPHAPFFAPFFRFSVETDDETEGRERLAAFLTSPRIRERTDDDLTLLLAAWE